MMEHKRKRVSGQRFKCLFRINTFGEKPDHCWMFPEHLLLVPPAAYKVTVKSHTAQGDFMIYTVKVDQVLHNSPGKNLRLGRKLRSEV